MGSVSVVKIMGEGKCPLIVLLSRLVVGASLKGLLKKLMKNSSW